MIKTDWLRVRPSPASLGPLATHHNPCLVLVQPKMTRPGITKIVDWDVKNQSNKQNIFFLYCIGRYFYLGLYVIKINIAKIACSRDPDQTPNLQWLS